MKKPLSDLFNKVPPSHLLEEVMNVVKDKYYVLEVEVTQTSVKMKTSPIVKRKETRLRPVGDPDIIDSDKPVRDVLDPSKGQWG